MHSSRHTVKPTKTKFKKRVDEQSQAGSRHIEYDDFEDIDYRRIRNTEDLLCEEEETHG